LSLMQQYDDEKQVSLNARQSMYRVHKRLADLLNDLDDLFMDVKHLQYALKDSGINVEELFMYISHASNQLKKAYDYLGDLLG